MSASVQKWSLWSRLFGPVNIPKARPETVVVAVAAHLQSMSPEAAARLMGPGSVPPRATSAAAPSTETNTVNSPQMAAASEDASRVLPWPLLRTTGIYQTEYSKTDRALALCTAELVAECDSEEHDTTEPAIAASPAPSRNLAGQLAVVARFNQPKSRAAGFASVKASAIKSQAKKTIGKAPVRSAQLSSPKSKAETHARPQAIVIDLASVKKAHRIGAARRAA